MELLEHPTLANAGSLAFEILAMEFPALHLPLVKQFYKQKLFQLVLAKLFNKLNEYSSHHLVAFTYVLKMTPHAVIKMNLEKVSENFSFNILKTTLLISYIHYRLDQFYLNVWPAKKRQVYKLSWT